MTPNHSSDTVAHPRIVPRRAAAPEPEPVVPPPPPRQPRRSRRPIAAEQQGRQPASPIKEATWKWYIPIYFWLGGIAAGSWVAITAEDLTGANDRDVVRAGRYLALGSVLGGTALLVLDLGRRERFLNMLRIVRSRSAMSLGSWGLTEFGMFTGVAATLQALADGALGSHAALERLAHGWPGRAVHVLGLPAALFVGSYTGVLLASTSTPAWAARTRVLGPLFLASGTASGISALGGVLGAMGGARPGVHRRLARAEMAALAAELALAMASHAAVRRLPSITREPAWQRVLRRIAIGAGIGVPLVVRAAHALQRGEPRRHLGRRDTVRRIRALIGRDERSRLERGPRGELACTALTLAGSLALRYLITHEGRRSARIADDTWTFTARRGRAPTVVLDRGEQLATEQRRQPARLRHRVVRGTVAGVITVAQEDRVRIVTENGRGYLFTVAKRRASLAQLERWRDARIPVVVRYTGIPDAGASAERIRPI
ncbi:MAG TPA: NrfD/PsrC family molybdoenzyme membrane anchor subunit [Gemmatimonadaceae bacterium]